MNHDPLSLFLPPVSRWFRAAFASPTPVQAQGWPSIAAGQNTLLLAPTGSGKTLAAFLACLDSLWRQPDLAPGVRILYISPLKALNNDIFRNLETPLAGIAQAARETDFPLPKLTVAVRTGDTPAAERQRLLRKPPHVLITTPESLHLLLTSRARDTLRGLTHCIVDEIHSLCPNKRGVFLALLLERLQALWRVDGQAVGSRTDRLETGRHGFVRIGLSATQRPLDEVARYLGGLERTEDGGYSQRPVTIIDAGLRKNLDLQVLSPVEQFGPLPEKTIWPSIYRLLANLVQGHRSTLVFANNRRTVERLTAQLQEELDGRALAPRVPDDGDVASGEPAGDASARVCDSRSESPTVRAHHGSVALEVRQQTEQALKDGRLAAVVATASLEMGIDMGAVDLVCQVESPGNVSRGLQRVGRAGHLVGRESKGRLIPKTLADLLDQAVLLAEMKAGRVEELRVPMNCLDVLAQQIVAMTAMDVWKVADLYGLIRQAYPFRDLTPAALDAVLEMVSGRFSFGKDELAVSSNQQLSALQPRISWDRVHQRLHPLPGSQRLALTHGGTIPDTGQYAAYTHQGQRIGELDEEFVYERRVGDTFLLGTSAWRIDKIEVDRLVVAPVEGMPAQVPFWRGERTGRSYDLGLAQGRFLRTLAERLDDPVCLTWLEREHGLQAAAARNLRDYVRRQLQRTGGVPSDQLLVIEAARDPLGDWQVVLHCPLGSRVNFTLRLALENVLRRRLGYSPQCLHHDDGVLIRLTDSEEPVLDVLAGIDPDNLRALVLEGLGDSALFALRFRQNAARALLAPRTSGGRRSPLWLQRLRGRDLLQVARQFADFPIVAETFRECLHDHLDVPHVEDLLRQLGSGQVAVRSVRLDAPSPFAASLWFAFNAATMYQYDGVEPEAGQTYARMDPELLDQLANPGGAPLALDPRAVHQVERRLRGVGQPPRTQAETAEWLRRLGDIGPAELEGSMAAFLQGLEADGVATRLDLPGVDPPERWILKEDEAAYRLVFLEGSADGEARRQAGEKILARFLNTHALVGLPDVLRRYPFDPGWAKRQLEEWARAGRLVAVPSTSGLRLDARPTLEWSAPANLEQMQRGTLALLRSEVITATAPQFADFLLRWQGLHPDARHQGADHLHEVLTRLQGCPLPADLWEQAVLPARLPDYQPRWLDDRIASGTWLWVGRDGGERGPMQLACYLRETFAQLGRPALDESASVGPVETLALDGLRQRGALFLTDLAQHTGATIEAVRAALWRLARLGLATNDHLDVVRRGQPEEAAAPVVTSRRPLRPGMRGSTRRRPLGSVPEGRWSLVPWTAAEVESRALFQAQLLLQRYGIVARDLAVLDADLPPWRVLYEVFGRLEMAGQVRRGYFVDGLSGAQFALPEAARQLQDLLGPAPGEAPLILIHSLDPANLYGSGAPLEIPFLNEEGRAFTRRPGNWLVLQAGRPLLLIEQQGKRLTAMPGLGGDLLGRAVALLPSIVGRDQRRDPRHKLSVETWNEEPVTASPGMKPLEAAGFVRDYQAMTWYAAWR